MAGRSKDAAEPATLEPGASPEAGKTGETTSPAEARRSVWDQPAWLWSALIIAFAWYALLLWMAFSTANPLTLNRLQILQSRYVVTATVDDAKAGTITVSKEWLAGRKLPRTNIAKLAETNAANGKTYLIPLSLTKAGQLIVTPARIGKGMPLIYPASDEAIEQLNAILKSEEL